MVYCANNWIHNQTSKAFADYNLHIDELKEYFSGEVYFQTRDLTEFYRSFEKDLKKSTINWRVYKLVNQGVLQRIGRGVFKLGESEKFTPVIDRTLQALYKKINNEFPYMEFCVWNTSFLNTLMLHQPFHFITVVETERDVTDSVFQFLKESKTQVFLNPGKEIIRNYLYDQQDAIIVKPLISESPLQELDKVKTATIEKILVDLFCDTDLYTAYQGVERKRIFQEAFSRYTINEKTLLRYADRRKRKGELKEYLNKLNVLALNDE